MPKIKTRRAAAKRFTMTGSGENFKRNKAFKSHILEKKSPKRKRNLRGTTVLGNKEQAKTIKSQLSS